MLLGPGPTRTEPVGPGGFNGPVLGLLSPKYFEYFQLTHIPREQNSRVDVLSKMASTSTKSPVKELQNRSIDEAEVNSFDEVEPNWMTPLRGYLEKGELPNDKDEARKTLCRSTRYMLE